MKEEGSQSIIFLQPKASNRAALSHLPILLIPIYGVVKVYAWCGITIFMTLVSQSW